MSKVTSKPGTMLYPVPTVMVSCGDGEKDNIITIGWSGIVNSEPPMTYVSVRKSRFSHHLIQAKKRIRYQPGERESGEGGGFLRRPFRRKPG